MDLVTFMIFEEAEPNFLDSLGPLKIGAWEIPLLGLILLLASLAILITGTYFIQRGIKNRIKYNGYAPDLLNALRFFMNIIFAVILAWLVLTFLSIESEYVLLVSGVVATAIAFASMKSMNNFIAGIWIALAQPFIVGDYVNIDGVEGIVVDIVLSYTKIRHKDQNTTMVPNLQCLKSDIINFTLSVSEHENRITHLNKYLQSLISGNSKKPKVQKLIAKLQVEMAEDEWIINQIKKLYDQIEKSTEILKHNEKSGENPTDLLTLDNFSEFTREGRFVRYCFTIELKKNLKQNQKVLDEICNKWEKVFRLLPNWELVGIGSHFKYQITILTPDPENILNNYDAFVTDVYSWVQ